MTILDYVSSTAWALEPMTIQRMLGIVIRHTAGERLEAHEVEAVLREARSGRDQPQGNYYLEDGTAVIPIYGLIAKHAHQVNDVSGPRGVSTKTVESDLRKALADPDVERVLLDIESPGGSIDGVAELADAVYAARGQKPITAFANDLMASAAYWIGAQADAVYSTGSALVGSIGVYSVVEDLSKRAAMLGIDVEVIRSAPLKGGADGAPVLREQKEVVQEIVDAAHERFVAAVARGRGVSASTVEEWATGRVFSADQSVELGLIDAIQSFSETLATGHGGRRTLASSSQEVPMSETTKAPAPSAEDMRAQDRQRLADLKSAFPDDLAFAVGQWEAGHGVTEAKAAYADVLAAKLAASEKDLAAAEKKAAKLAATEPKPVGVSPVRQGSGGQPGNPAAFLVRLKELQAEGHSADRALSIAAGEDPERHMAFVASAPANQTRSARQQFDRLRDLHGVGRED